MWMIAVCCTRRASICDARDNSLRDFHARGPLHGGAEVSLSVRIGAAGERPPGASAACHLTPSCFETQVRATDEQHLLWPAFETIAKRPENFLLGRTSKQSCSVGHEVAPLACAAKVDAGIRQCHLPSSHVLQFYFRLIILLGVPTSPWLLAYSAGQCRTCIHRLYISLDLDGRLLYFPMQKVLKIRLRMSSVVVAPVISSRGRRAP